MCGIIGIIGTQEVTPRLIEGLKRLEYRGYDSAGVATLSGGVLHRCRAEGKIANLEARTQAAAVPGTLGIGHTRWATHGIPSEKNAHPHATDRVAVVHNGIIENFQDLRAELEAAGSVFQSETDTEVIAHLITAALERGLDPRAAVHTSVARLKGAFALAILITDAPGALFGARLGSPMAVGFGDGEMFLGSDALALAPMTRRIAYLEDGDRVELTADGAEIFDASGAVVAREIKQTALTGAMIGKGNHRHFMIKEIYEQPQVIGDTLGALFNPVNRTVTLPPLPFDLADVPKVSIVACGTAYLAGLTAKYWIEKYARVPVEVDIASEFRYREPPLPKGGLALFVSQSGETLDTLAALRYCKAQGQHTVGVVNVAESAIAREADVVLPTLAGPEIGVASTKAFTTQLVVLACLAIALGRARGAIDAEAEARLSTAITEVPALVAEVLGHDEAIQAMAHDLTEVRDVLYLGRGPSYPIALEGALKLKEISYIHAEGYAAGEMKHGPIALIDEDVPVVVIAPRDDVFDKTLSNVQQVTARGGKVIFLSDAAGCRAVDGHALHTIALPEVDPFVAPILYALPVQLLAYHTAVLKGTDVDQPRNLAKSVTVE